MNKIRILVVAPDKEPKQIKIEHTLKNLQGIVGGLIEFVELEYNVDLICNEEGKINNLPLNRVVGADVIAGTFIIAGQHLGDTISLSRKQIKKYKKVFRLEKDRAIIERLRATARSSDLIRYGVIAPDGTVTYF